MLVSRGDKACCRLNVKEDQDQDQEAKNPKNMEASKISRQVPLFRHRARLVSKSFLKLTKNGNMNFECGIGLSEYAKSCFNGLDLW